MEVALSAAGCVGAEISAAGASGEKVSTVKLALRDALAEKLQFIRHALPPDPDKSDDFNDRRVLKAMVEAMIGAEAPLRDDILARRVARAHGWFRTCSKIRGRVELRLRDVDRMSESSGTFVRKRGTVVNFLDCRAPLDLAGRRAVADIPLAEPAAFVLSEKDAFDQPDPAPDVASRIRDVPENRCFLSCIVPTCISASVSAICRRTSGGGCARRGMARSAGWRMRRAGMARV